MRRKWVIYSSAGRQISWSFVPPRPIFSPRWRPALPTALPQRSCSPRTSRSLRSEEHTSELQSLMRISYAVFCLKNKNKVNTEYKITHNVHIKYHDEQSLIVKTLHKQKR